MHSVIRHDACMLQYLQEVKGSSLSRQRGGTIPQVNPSSAESPDGLPFEFLSAAMSLQPGVSRQALQAKSGTGSTEASESSRMQLLPGGQSLIPSSFRHHPAGCLSIPFFLCLSSPMLLWLTCMPRFFIRLAFLWRGRHWCQQDISGATKTFRVQLS